MLSRNCPSCGAGKSRDLGGKSGFEIKRCRRCATLFTSQLPSTETAYDYDGYYRPSNIDKPEFLNRRLDEIMGDFASFRQSGRLLDIGCGGGEWLQAARRAGWKAQGLEVSAPVVAYLREQDFEIFHGFLEEAHYPDDHFDVVLAIEILEHVPDAQAILREAARILRPGGVLWATTPHGNGLSARLLSENWREVAPPEHLQLFGKRAMQRMLRRAGFARARVQTHGVNPFQLMQSLQSLRVAKNGVNPTTGGSQIQSNHQLNEFLTEKPARRWVKDALNHGLNATRLGDSLKIRAVK